MLFPLPPIPADAPRVVITGAGIITALGTGWESNAEAFRVGRTAFRPVTQFDVAGQRVKVAAEIDLPERLPATHLSAREAARLDRSARFLLLASREAWQHAGWKSGGDLPFVLGTTTAGINAGEAYYRQAIRQPKRRRQQPSRVLQFQAQRQALAVAKAIGFAGPVIIIANGCAAGTNAIGHAWWLLRRGHADRILAGGYDSLSQLVFNGFDSLLALSPTQCRPFDAQRDGLALGEGAAVVALETLDSARRRKATILGEVIGYGATTDAHHLTHPHPQGDAAYESIRLACSTAGITAQAVNYINAHGTGSLLSDHAEAQAINRWAGEHAATIAVSSTKASIGHLLGAAGAVEAVVCLMALRGQWLPPTITVQNPDPVCRFELVRKPTAAPIKCALSHSLGFGGANATVILRIPEESS